MFYYTAYNAKQVSSPQPGDLVFFTFSHVEIVSRVVNGVPYSVGGNNGGTGYYGTNYCRAEHKVSTTGSVRLYLRPNYKNQLKKWYDEYSPVDIGDNFYGKIKSQYVDWYFTNNNGNVEGQELKNDESQIWKFERQPNNSYKIISKSSGDILDLSGEAESVEGTNLWTYWVDTGNSNQRFFFYEIYGALYMRSECSDLVLDMDLNNYPANVAVYGYGGDWTPMKFEIEKVKMTSPTPTITTLSSSSLKLTWKAEPNATSYRIDRRKSGDGTAYETIATTKDTKYTDTGLEANTKYWYRVYAVAGSDKSSEKNSVSGTTYTLTSPTPTISTLSTSSLKLTWKSASNATSYRIDRRKSGDGTAYETIATTKNTTYTDTGLEANTKYWYRVYAVADYTSSEKNSVSGTTDRAVTNCNIKLYDNGQCLSESLVKSGTKLDEFLLPTMSKNGYKFEGWYTAKNGGTMYPIGSIVPDAKELILYAHWTKIEIKGDINQDNKLTMTDAVLLQKHILNLKPLSSEQLKLADINSDGKVNIFDLSLLKANLK